MPRAITHLIEYHPYRYRNECCAVGLLVLLPGGEVQVHLAENLRKVRAMHPAVELDVLRDELLALGTKLTHEPELLPLYLSAPAGPLKIGSSAGHIDYVNADELLAGVKWALGYMVEPVRAPAQRERPSVSRLYVELKNYFADMGWLAVLGQSIHDHRIIPRYSLSSEEAINVDFALRNTAIHYLQTADFRTVSNPTQKRHEVQAKWFALGLAGSLTPLDLVGSGVRTYAVIAGSDTEEGRKAIKVAHRVAQAGVFVSESSSDMEELLGIYARAMKQEPMGRLPTSGFN